MAESQEPEQPWTPSGYPQTLTHEEEKLVQETRFYSALADKAKIDAEYATKEWHSYKNSTTESRIYYFLGPVEYGTAQQAIVTIGQWHREDPEKDITVVFNSPGGEITPGLALYDFLLSVRDTGTKVRTEALGWAASMGGILLQAGDERVMGQHAYMLIHEISGGAAGNLSELEDAASFIRRLQERCLDILAERANVDRDFIKEKWERRDWWLDAKEALEHGFCDRIA